MTERSSAVERDVWIERVFDAPRELVFEAWANPEHLVRWYAPSGCSLEIRSMDIRPGGLFHTCIRNPEYPDCWCVGQYVEVVRPERLAFTIALANERGERTDSDAAGKDPDWPSETTVTVTFDEVPGGTKVTLHQTAPESVARRTGAYPSWLDMLDRLANLLRRDRNA